MVGQVHISGRFGATPKNTQIVAAYHTPAVRPQILRPPHGLIVTHDWSEFLALTDHASCEVLIVPQLSRWPYWSDFIAHQRAVPATPRVLVTRPDPENLRLTINTALDGLAWLEEDGRVSLGPAVQLAASRGLMHRCRNLFANADGLNTELRQALTKACEPGPPVRSVNDLAEVAGRDRRTVSAGWTRCVGPRPAVRLKALLDLLLLLRAIERRQHGERWPRVARELEVSLDVLRRTAKARLGIGLGRMRLDTGRAIVSHLEGLLRGEPARWPLEAVGDD